MSRAIRLLACSSVESCNERKLSLYLNAAESVRTVGLRAQVTGAERASADLTRLSLCVCPHASIAMSEAGRSGVPSSAAAPRSSARAMDAATLGGLGRSDLGGADVSQRPQRSTTAPCPSCPALTPHPPSPRSVTDEQCYALARVLHTLLTLRSSSAAPL